MAVDRADASETPDLTGTAYRYVREIGRGGMGSVHEVEHRALGKRFVMKVLHEKLAHREDFALRLQSEWRILAKLEHPAIVVVTDAGRSSEGLPFFVMERLEGETVAEALRRRGPWSALEAARLLLVVLSGLEAAHAAGAIHRDIKPQNLFLTPRGPKILDFGIVKRKNAALQTRSGVAIGTPRYMAPEQAAGLAVDGRTDIYACALVLFEMIAGRDPYAHLSDQAALVGAQISEPSPRLDDVRFDAPAPLADLLQRWLAKEAADRPASARLARIELEALLPLLEAAGGAGPVIPSEEQFARGPNESTAGRTSDSALLSPATTAPDAGARHGVRETVTLSSELLDPAPEDDEGVGDARLPSVTPPPLTGAGAPRAKGSPSRWLVASLGVLSALGLGLGALVLSPDFGGGQRLTATSLRPPEFHFPETTVAPEPRAGIPRPGASRPDGSPNLLESSGAAPTLAASALAASALPASAGRGAAPVAPAPVESVSTENARPAPAVAAAGPRGAPEDPGAGAAAASPGPQAPDRPAPAAPGSAPAGAGPPSDGPAESRPVDLPGSGLW